MLVDYQLWRLHKTLSEANDIIANVNRHLVAQQRKRFFWEEDKGVIEIPGDEEEGKVYPTDTSTTPTQKKLSKAEAMAQLPKLGYLYKRSDGQPGAQWYIDEEKKKNTDPKFNAEKAGIRQCLVVAFKEEEKKQRDGIRFPPGVIVNKINHRVFNYDQIQDKITELVNKEELDCCDALNIRIALKDKLHELGRHVIDMLNFPLKMPGNVQIDKNEVEDTFERFYRRDMGELQGERRKQDCGDCGGFRSSSRWQQPQQQRPQRSLPPRGTSRMGGRTFGRR
jgi:hypothetical protein